MAAARERLFVLKVQLSSRVDFENFVWRLGFVLEMDGNNYVISRRNDQGVVFRGDYDSALRHFARYSIKAPAWSIKVLAIFHRGDLVMFCDTLETFFARAGRSYVSTPMGYAVYINSSLRATYPSLEDAFLDLGREGWSYVQNLTEPRSQNKLYACFGPRKAFLGCFPDLQSTAKYAVEMGLAAPPKSKITTMHALKEYWSGLEALGWRMSTPRVVERGHVDPLSSSPSEEMVQLIDQRLALAHESLEKRAALLREMVKRPGCQLNAAGVDAFFG